MNGITILFPADPCWREETEKAKQFDRYCVAEHGQRDTDLHLCSTQKSQQRRGYLIVRLYQNIYGWCIRDTMNDGLGNMSGNMKTREEAIAWAKDLHAKMAGKCEVVEY